MNFTDVIDAWDKADPVTIHPLRQHGEEPYWDSGVEEAWRLAPHLSPTGKIVDFGCGDGRVASPLAAMGRKVIGVDSSQRMLDRVSGDVETVLSTGEDLLADLGGKKAASLYCLAVLIHHDYESCARLIEQFARAVRVGGTLILDWPLAAVPSEREHWIGVTTWSQAKQKRIEDACNLTRVPAPDLPYAVYKVGK